MKCVRNISFLMQTGEMHAFSIIPECALCFSESQFY
jgi:hypothetical protein